MFLTTKNPPEIIETTNRRGKIVKKPTTVFEYNKLKSFIDVSDQKGSYGTCVRKSVKWYRKIGFEILLNTSVVNAHWVSQKIPAVKNYQSITSFREELAMQLIKSNKQGEGGTPQQDRHLLQESHELVEGEKRSRCSRCYQQLSSSYGRNHAVKNCKRVKTVCIACGKKSYCLPCFFVDHKANKL